MAARRLRELEGHVWKDIVIPEFTSPPSMLLEEERRLLYYLASRWFEGRGAIIDAGAFLGGSTTALCSGVEVFFRRAGLPSRPVIHSYDLFAIEPWTIGRFFSDSCQAGDNFHPEFDKHISRFRHLVHVYCGDIRRHAWSGNDIEILFIDCAKHPQISDFVVKNFFGSLIPNRSIIIQQDYLYDSWSAWLPITMEYYADCFEMICHTNVNSVAFLCTQKIIPERLSPQTVMSLETGEQRVLSARAISRFTGEQRVILTRASEQYFELLEKRGREWFSGLICD
jgi:hypothetical protein